jgi:hypothetical protein
MAAKWLKCSALDWYSALNSTPKPHQSGLYLDGRLAILWGGIRLDFPSNILFQTERGIRADQSMVWSTVVQA